MLSLVDYTKGELSRITEEMLPETAKTALAVLSTILEYFHQENCSADDLVGLLDRLVKFKPLTPILDQPDMWESVGAAPDAQVKVYRHLRCPSLHKNVNLNTGEAVVFDIDANVVSIDGGINWLPSTDVSMFKVVEFPYYPSTIPEFTYAKLNEEGKYVVITDTEEIEAIRSAKFAEYAEAQAKLTAEAAETEKTEEGSSELESITADVAEEVSDDGN